MWWSTGCTRRWRSSSSPAWSSPRISSSHRQTWTRPLGKLNTSSFRIFLYNFGFMNWLKKKYSILSMTTTLKFLDFSGWEKNSEWNRLFSTKVTKVWNKSYFEHSRLVEMVKNHPGATIPLSIFTIGSYWNSSDSKLRLLTFSLKFHYMSLKTSNCVCVPLTFLWFFPVPGPKTIQMLYFLSFFAWEMNLRAVF